MHQFRLVVTLSVVILSTVSQFEAASAQTRLAIGYAAVSPRTTPLYLAQEQGIFSKYGLDPKIVLVRAAATLVATLVSGEMDVGYTGGTSVLGAAGQGSYLKILSSISNTLTHTLVAHPSLKRAEELRGKRFGIQSIGGGVWKTATVWLEHFGMDEKRDNIQMIVIGDVTILSQALETGRIDATVVPGFLSRRLAEKGFVVLGRCEQTRLSSVGMTVLVENPYLQQNSETLQNVIKALIEGMVFITAGKHKSAVLDTISKQFKLTDPAAAEGAYQDVFTLVRLEEYRKPYVSMEGLKILQRLMKSQNPRIGDIKVENLVDSSVLKKIDDSGFFERLYAEYGIK